MPSPEEMKLSQNDRNMMKSDTDRTREKTSFQKFDALLKQYGDLTIHGADGEEWEVSYGGEVEKIIAAVSRETPALMQVSNPALVDRQGDLQSYREKMRGKSYQEILSALKPYGAATSRAIGKEGKNLWNGNKEAITDENYRYIQESPRGKFRNAYDVLNLSVSRLEIIEGKIDPLTEVLPKEPEALKALQLFYETRYEVLIHPMTPPELRAKAFTKFSLNSPDGKERAANMIEERKWLEERIKKVKEALRQ